MGWLPLSAGEPPQTNPRAEQIIQLVYRAKAQQPPFVPFRRISHATGQPRSLPRNTTPRHTRPKLKHPTRKLQDIDSGNADLNSLPDVSHRENGMSEGADCETMLTVVFRVILRPVFVGKYLIMEFRLPSCGLSCLFVYSVFVGLLSSPESWRPMGLMASIFRGFMTLVKISVYKLFHSKSSLVFIPNFVFNFRRGWWLHFYDSAQDLDLLNITLCEYVLFCLFSTIFPVYFLLVNGSNQSSRITCSFSYVHILFFCILKGW